MTISEAFRNRGLLVPEMMKPFYRVTYGENDYTKDSVIFQTESWKTAREELTERFGRFAKRKGIREDCVLAIHCIPKPEEWEEETCF